MLIRNNNIGGIMFKKGINLLVLGVFCLVITGCGTTAKFIYPSNMSNLVQLAPKPITDKTIAVLPFEDFRDDDNSNYLALYLIPLFPSYGYCTYTRPEAAMGGFPSIFMFQCNVSEDLAKASAMSLRRSNLFRNAAFSFGELEARSDFEFIGSVNEFFYKGRIFAYGLSVYGPLLWLLGAPVATSLNRVNITFKLRDSKTKEILWDYNFEKEIWFNQWLYSRMGRDVVSFAKLYEEGMNKSILDLQKQMGEDPKKFGLE